MASKGFDKKYDGPDKRQPAFDVAPYVLGIGLGRTMSTWARGKAIFSEGQSANAIYYIQHGQIKISTVSQGGKQAVLSLSGPGDFAGETALTDHHALRTTSAVAVTNCILLRIEMAEMRRLLREDMDFSRLFVDFLLVKTNRLQEFLVDRLFNQSEQRLARILVALAGPLGEQTEVGMLVRITHQTLAEMVGTTRPRITFFPNRFKRLQFTDHRRGQLYLKSSLYDQVLSDYKYPPALPAAL